MTRKELNIFLVACLVMINVVTKVESCESFNFSSGKYNCVNWIVMSVVVDERNM